MVCIKLINAKKGRDRKQYTTAASKEINLEKVPLLTKDRALKQANSSYLQTKVLREFSLWKSSGIFSKRYKYQRQLKNQVFRDFSLWKSVWACFTFWFAITSAKFSYLKFLFIFMVIVLEFFSQEKSSKDTKVKNCGKKMKL